MAKTIYAVMNNDNEILAAVEGESVEDATDLLLESDDRLSMGDILGFEFIEVTLYTR